MLYLIVYYLLITFLSLWSGFIFYGCIGCIQGEKLQPRSWILYIITGFIFCVLFAQFVVLFMPLQLTSLGIYLTLLLLLQFSTSRWMTEPFPAFLKRKVETLNKTSPIIIGAFVLFIAFINSGPILMDDTDSYHIQMIKWIQEHGTVPGIANLHVRYGLNSSWFVACGFLLQPLDTHTPYIALNGLLSVWTGIYLLHKAILSFEKNIDLTKASVSVSAFIIFCLMIFCWPMIRGNATNANYDFITSAILVILMLETLQQDEKKLYPEFFIWSCFLFSVRFINYPWLIVAITALIILLRKKQKKMIGTLIVIGALLVLPFLIRNYIISGYLFFPVHQIDLLDADWKADPGVMAEYVHFTRAFNRVNEMHMPIEKTSSLPFPDWMVYWYHYLSFTDKILIVLSGVSMIILVVNVKKIMKQEKVLRILAAIALVHIISWFIVSPDPRFAYGPLLINIGVAAFIVFPVRFTRTAIISLRMLVPLSVVSLLAFGAMKGVKDERYRNYIKPLSLPVAPLKKTTINGIEFYIPEKIEGNWNPRCFNSTIPCLYEIQPGLQPRGKTIHEGFRRQKLKSPSEK